MSNYFRMFENVILFSGHERKDLPPMDWGDKGVKGTLAMAQKWLIHVFDGALGKPNHMT